VGNGSVASKHVVVAGTSVALNSDASSTLLKRNHNIGAVAKVVVLDIGRRGIGTESLGSFGTAKVINSVFPDNLPRIHNGSIDDLKDTFVVGLGQLIVVDHGNLGEGAIGSRANKRDGSRLGDLSYQVDQLGVAAVLFGGHLGNEGVSRAFALEQEETPAGVVLGSVKGVATIGSAGSKGSGVFTEVEALVVHDVTRHGDHLCGNHWKESKACHEGQGVILERQHC